MFSGNRVLGNIERVCYREQNKKNRVGVSFVLVILATQMVRQVMYPYGVISAKKWNRLWTLILEMDQIRQCIRASEYVQSQLLG